MDISFFRGRSFLTGQKVKVYRNLNNGRISIMDPVSGLVVAHADSVTLFDVYFEVRESGRQFAIKTGHRNIHAFAVGDFACSGKMNTQNWEQFTYNPFKHESFVDRFTGFPVVRATKVHIAREKYFYLI